MFVMLSDARCHVGVGVLPQDNGVGDDGAIAMTEALIQSHTLKWIYLDGNGITDQGGKVKKHLEIRLGSCTHASYISAHASQRGVLSRVK